MSIRPPPRIRGKPATPDECPLMRAILNAAQVMFPGDPWEEVEPYLRRAWRTIIDPTPWEDVRAWMHTSWLKQNAGIAANDGDARDDSARPPSSPPPAGGG